MSFSHSEIDADPVAFTYSEPGSSSPAHKHGSPYRSQANESNEAPAQKKITEEESLRRAMQAHLDGIKEGEERARTQAEELIALERRRIADAVARFQQQSDDYYKKIELEVVKLSLAIASKILHREAQVDKLLLMGVAKVAIQKIALGTSITVRVNPQQLKDWKDYFADVSSERKLSVAPNPEVALNDCFIETELGVAQLGIESQLKEIERGFLDLLAARPQIS
jgi:flagellar assembly protein FliH